MLRRILTTLTVATFLSGGVYAASSAEVDRLVKEHNLEVVDMHYVKEKIGDGTIGNAKALILDARPFKKYEAGHIPASLPMPDNEMEKYKDSLKGKAKDSEIIIYCGGMACEKSPLVAIELKKEGYTDTKIYRGGLPEWQKNSYINISLSAAKTIFDKNGALFIDARPYPKFAQETIIGSINIPDGEFPKLWKRLPTVTTEPVVIFCGGLKCEKSHIVAEKMTAMGYTSVMTLSDGLPGWKKAGYPTTGSGTAVAKKVEKADKFAGPLKLGEDGAVDGKHFKELVKNLPDSVVIVDIRGAEDFKNGYVPGSINIERKGKSLEEFAALLPKDKYVVLNCSTGTRSLEAYMDLRDKLKYKNIDKTFYLDAEVNCDKSNKCEIKPFEY